jgi:S-DNA-T family DNA segregation ATPase FtsK/SpoIIIE
MPNTEYTYNAGDSSSSILDAAKSFATDSENKRGKAAEKKNAKEKKSAFTDDGKSNRDIRHEDTSVPNDDGFSNGIDEIFGSMDDVRKPDTRRDAKNTADTFQTRRNDDRGDTQVSEKSDDETAEEKKERASKISDREKNAYNSEFNEAIEKPAAEYVYPSLSLLNKPSAVSGDKREEMRRTAEKLISVLDNFGVKAKLLQVTQGPTVTRYEIQPDTGVKLSKIVGLADDIALNLAVSTVLVAPVPGKAAVGVEIPNNKVSPVSIREMLESDAFKNAKSKLTVALGKDIGGNVVIGDIAKMPHVLIAGATGSGKSVCINTIIMSLLFKSSPEDVKLIMIDPKVVELGVYNGIPHLLVPVVTEPKKAAGALNWAVTEMMRRYDLFKDTGVRKLESYNKLMESTGGEKIPQLVVIIDELADLMMVAAKEVEDYVCRLAQLARAAGIHLIIATQRPSVDVITGLIKANIPSRIAFAVSSQVDSRTILDKGGAEKLLGMGDMLYHPSGARASTRVQGAFVSDPEIENVLNFIKENVGETHYSDDLAEEIERHATGENGVTPDVDDDGDALLPEARKNFNLDGSAPLGCGLFESGKNNRPNGGARNYIGRKRLKAA